MHEEDRKNRLGTNRGGALYPWRRYSDENFCKNEIINQNKNNNEYKKDDRRR